MLAFLDRLTYGEQGTPGTHETRLEWRETVKQTERVLGVRLLGRSQS